MIFFKRLFNLDHVETKGDILFFRMFETIIIWQVIFFAWIWGFYIRQLSGVILPLGIANYVDISFMFHAPFALLNAALITVFAVLAYLHKGRYYYLLILLCLHLQYVVRFSQGKVGHGSNYTGMALIALSVAALLIKDRSDRRKIAIGLFIFFIGIAYTSAASSKLIASGPQWVNGSHLYLWISERSIDKLAQDGIYQLNIIQKLLLHYHGLATLLLTVSIISEFCGFLLWFKKTRWIETTLLIGMHVGIYLTMSIAFNSYIIILLVVGYPWEVLFNYLLDKTPLTILDQYLERESVQY